MAIENGTVCETCAHESAAFVCPNDSCENSKIGLTNVIPVTIVHRVGTRPTPEQIIEKAKLLAKFFTKTVPASCPTCHVPYKWVAVPHNKFR